MSKQNLTGQYGTKITRHIELSMLGASYVVNVESIKVVLQRTLLFPQTNDLCTCITKIAVIFLKIKQFLLKKRTSLFQYFVL